MIAAFAISALARAGFVFAREGVLGLIDPTPLPLPARIGALARAARSSGRTTGAARARLADGADAARAVLCEARPVPGDAARCRRRRARARSRDAAGPDGAVPAGRRPSAMIEDALGEPLDELFISFGAPVAAASIAQVHRAEVAYAGRRARGRGQGAAAGHRAALQRRSRRACISRRAMPSASRPKRGGCA